MFFWGEWICTIKNPPNQPSLSVISCCMAEIPSNFPVLESNQVGKLPGARCGWGNTGRQEAAPGVCRKWTCPKPEGRKFSQSSGGGSPGLMETWVLLQGVGLQGKERVTYWCQDRGEGTQSLESLGHLSFLSQKVAVFHSPPILIIRKQQQTQP